MPWRQPGLSRGTSSAAPAPAPHLPGEPPKMARRAGPHSPTGGTAADEKEPMRGNHPKIDLRKTLTDVRDALKGSKRPVEDVLSLLGRMDAGSSPDAWDELFYGLVALGEKKPADRVAEACRHVRLRAWREIDGDTALSEVRPMLDQFALTVDDAEDALRTMLLAMSNAARRPLQPGYAMRVFIVNMARFGSTVDDRVIRAVVEELYVRRGHHGHVCDMCEDMMAFKGLDKLRMASSTLVEDLLGAVLARMQYAGTRVPSPYAHGGVYPLLPDLGSSLRGRTLDRCAAILGHRAKHLGLAVTPAPPKGSVLSWAMALALGISARRQAYRPAELAEHARLLHPRSYRFLRLGHPHALSRLADPGSQLAQNILLAMTSERLEGSGTPMRFGQDALGLLDVLLECMDRSGHGADLAITKRWRAGIRGSRLWGSLLDMEMRLRLRATGSAVPAGLGSAGGGAALDIDGCRIETRSAMDDMPPARGSAAQAGDPSSIVARAISGQARLAGTGTTVVIVDCPAEVFPDLGILAARLEPPMSSGDHPAALCLVRRDGGLYAHKFLKNPSSQAGVPGSAKRLIERSLDLDIIKLAGHVFQPTLRRSARP